MENSEISTKSFTTIFKKKLNDIWFSKTDAKYFIHCGPTGSGKTHNSIKRLKESGNGVYLAPLRLLAWEIYDRLVSENIPCNLITGEEQNMDDRAQITSSTIEMMDYSKQYDVVIVDESFMIQDVDRGKSWLKAILTSQAKEIHIILNEEVLELMKIILDITRRDYEIKNYEPLQKFYISHLPFQLAKKNSAGGVFVTFSRINVLIQKMRFEKMGRTVSILYGNLPPEVKKKQIQDFIDGKTELMVCTDVIGMGINVPCNYIIFLDIEKFDGKTNRRLTPIEVKQIAGRTGRYGLSKEDCFVSSVSKDKCNYLITKYNEEQKIQKAYIGFDYDMLSSFPDETPIADRINKFKTSKFIPKKLVGRVEQEDVEKYLSICHLIDRKEFDLKTKWHLLTAPVKENNKTYFNTLVMNYAKSFQLILPSKKFWQRPDAKALEDSISELELFLNMSRHLDHLPSDKDEAILRKNELIEQLTQALIDKKLSTKKKCKLCENLLDIDYAHPYCENCYQTKVRAEYNDYAYNW